MKARPRVPKAFVVRIDFSSEAAWNSLCRQLRKKVDGCKLSATLVDDPALKGKTLKSIAKLKPEVLAHPFVFLVDRKALSHPDHPVRVVDLLEDYGASFRVIPAEMAAVEANLSLANMGFSEFAEAVDKDGIFRGFEEAPTGPKPGSAQTLFPWPIVPCGKKLYVGNLTSVANVAMLHRCFSRYGEVVAAEVFEAGRLLKPAYGFVEMATDQQAADAVQGEDGTDWLGRVAHVTWDCPQIQQMLAQRGAPPPGK